MQLSKLHKHSHKVSRNYLKFKYLSLGVLLPPTATLTSEERAHKMIDADALPHAAKKQQILLTSFNNQLPATTRVKATNRFYALFQQQIKNSFVDETQQNSEDLRQSHKPEKQQGSLRRNKSNSKKRLITIVSKSMVKVYTQADKMHQIKKFRVAKMEKQIEKLFLESHDLYVRMMEIKSTIEENEKDSTVKKESSEDMEKEKTQNKLAANLKTKENAQCMQECDMITKRINKVKEAISKKQDEYRKLAEEERNLSADKVQFLRLLLKNGYYQSDGIWWILAKLAKNNQQLNLSHFPDLLDQITKQHILSQYHEFRIRLGKKQTGTLPKIMQAQKQKEVQIKPQYQSLQQVTYSKLMQIPHEENRRKIYREAQTYIVDWVRKEKWKVRSLKHRSSQSKFDSLNMRDWRNAEIKRLKRVYPKQKCDQMLEYIFGNPKYEYKNGFPLLQSFESSVNNYDTASNMAFRSVDHLSRNNTNT